MIILDHAIYNVALLGKFGKERRRWIIAAIILGAVFPDLATAAYVVFYRFIVGVPPDVLWGEHYEGSVWDVAANYLHSLPLVTIFLLVALVFRTYGAGFFFGSWFLHAVADFVVHHTDAHSQFLPFSDWIFRSPISYWEATYHGVAVGTIEIVGALSLLVVLWRRYRSRVAHIAITGSALILGTILLTNAFGEGLCPPMLERIVCGHQH